MRVSPAAHARSAFRAPARRESPSAARQGPIASEPSTTAGKPEHWQLVRRSDASRRRQNGGHAPQLPPQKGGDAGAHARSKDPRPPRARARARTNDAVRHVRRQRARGAPPCAVVVSDEDARAPARGRCASQVGRRRLAAARDRCAAPPPQPPRPLRAPGPTAGCSRNPRPPPPPPPPCTRPLSQMSRTRARRGGPARRVSAHRRRCKRRSTGGLKGGSDSRS